MINEKVGVCVILYYTGPKKKVELPVSFGGSCIEECFSKAAELLAKNKGKYRGGYHARCLFTPKGIQLLAGAQLVTQLAVDILNGKTASTDV